MYLPDERARARASQDGLGRRGARCESHGGRQRRDREPAGSRRRQLCARLAKSAGGGRLAGDDAPGRLGKD
jgi:hypothetical protein